ncbi:MAG: hypothetical protein ACREGR_03480 [Minisyncoccia bacterium]
MNADTTLEHLPLYKLGFYVTRFDSVITLFKDPMDCNNWLVADFDVAGYCTNASSFHQLDKAWWFFMEIVTLDLDGKSDPPHDYVPSPETNEEGPLERAFLRGLNSYKEID